MLVIVQAPILGSRFWNKILIPKCSSLAFVRATIVTLAPRAKQSLAKASLRMLELTLAYISRM